MTDWSLSFLLAGLQSDIQQKLETARKTLAHPGTKGDASQAVWLELLQTYLPKRYEAKTAHIVDSTGMFSDQIDVVVFDRQYSPFIFSYQNQFIIPAESVYAVFEAKQSINAAQVDYAQKKVASVRKLQRTSLPIPHAGGIYTAKDLIPIIGGILTLESDWKPAIGQSLTDALNGDMSEGRLDLGCIAAHGYFSLNPETASHEAYLGDKAATAFLFKLISQLQSNATVPMIDIQAYARWLSV